MRLLVAELKKRCHAALKPRRAAKASGSRQRDNAEAKPSRQRDTGEADLSRQRDGGTPRQHDSESATRQRDTVPAAVRRRVWSRDGWQCADADNRGVRCRETAYLELHHLHPHARGGMLSAANLTLRCKAHNALAAEQDFGRDFMQAKRAEQVAGNRVPG